MPASQAGRRRFESGRPLQKLRGYGETRNPFTVSSDQAVSGPHGVSPLGYVLAFTSCSAHAFANPAFGDLSPRGVAQPPSSTNCRCRQESIFWNAASFAAALGCFMKLATQEGVSATKPREFPPPPPRAPPAEAFSTRS